MFSCQSTSCYRSVRASQMSVYPAIRGATTLTFESGSFSTAGAACGPRPYPADGVSAFTNGVPRRRPTLALGVSDSGIGGNGGTGRYNRGSGNGGSSENNNNDNNNDGNGGNNNGGGGCNHNGFDDQLRRCFAPALLGGMALVAASAAFPAASRATPGSLSGFLHMGGSVGSGKATPLLSSSAPRVGGGGFLGDSYGASLERSSLGASPSASSTSTSPIRPRSKVMHVTCKGSTLVVPLTGANGEAKMADAPAAPRFLRWQRRKIVEAPVELSEREARMLAARQNRVRDSLLVQ